MQRDRFPRGRIEIERLLHRQQSLSPRGRLWLAVINYSQIIGVVNSSASPQRARLKLSASVAQRRVSTGQAARLA
jgi:hypothetical protein